MSLPRIGVQQTQPTDWNTLVERKPQNLLGMVDDTWKMLDDKTANKYADLFGTERREASPEEQAEIENELLGANTSDKVADLENEDILQSLLDMEDLFGTKPKVKPPATIDEHDKNRGEPR